MKQKQANPRIAEGMKWWKSEMKATKWEPKEKVKEWLEQRFFDSLKEYKIDTKTKIITRLIKPEKTRGVNLGITMEIQISFSEYFKKL